MEFRGQREMPVDSERSRSIRDKVLESSRRSQEVSQSVFKFPSRPRFLSWALKQAVKFSAMLVRPGLFLNCCSSFHIHCLNW